jgi:hypothetical protein
MTDEAELRELVKGLSARCSIYEQLIGDIIDSVSIIGHGVSFRQVTYKEQFWETYRKLESGRTALSPPAASADKVPKPKGG